MTNQYKINTSSNGPLFIVSNGHTFHTFETKEAAEKFRNLANDELARCRKNFDPSDLSIKSVDIRVTNGEGEPQVRMDIERGDNGLEVNNIELTPIKKEGSQIVPHKKLQDFAKIARPFHDLPDSEERAKAERDKKIDEITNSLAEHVKASQIKMICDEYSHRRSAGNPKSYLEFIRQNLEDLEKEYESPQTNEQNESPPQKEWVRQAYKDLEEEYGPAGAESAEVTNKPEVEEFVIERMMAEPLKVNANEV